MFKTQSIPHQRAQRDPQMQDTGVQKDATEQLVDGKLITDGGGPQTTPDGQLTLGRSQQCTAGRGFFGLGGGRCSEKEDEIECYNVENHRGKGCRGAGTRRPFTAQCIPGVGQAPHEGGRRVGEEFFVVVVVLGGLCWFFTSGKTGERHG